MRHRGRSSGPCFVTNGADVKALGNTQWTFAFLCVTLRKPESGVPAKKQPPDDWPKLVKVWRGCSRQRVPGVAWTLDRTVAEGFARGHRFPVPDPVLACAEIPKTAIYFFENERKEQEVVLDPSKLRAIVIHEFKPIYNSEAAMGTG
jgi:hypothetical protein